MPKIPLYVTLHVSQGFAVKISIYRGLRGHLESFPYFEGSFLNTLTRRSKLLFPNYFKSHFGWKRAEETHVEYWIRCSASTLKWPPSSNANIKGKPTENSSEKYLKINFFKRLVTREGRGKLRGRRREDAKGKRSRELFVQSLAGLTIENQNHCWMICRAYFRFALLDVLSRSFFLISFLLKFYDEQIQFAAFMFCAI